MILHKIKYITLIGCVILAFVSLEARDDDDQVDLRIDPEIDADFSQYSKVEIDYPQYINLEANHIEMNGADWRNIGKMFAAADSCCISIVHIGDSHLQADMGTAVTRRRLGEHYGSAGRALIVPFKLAGTNEPYDYSIRTDVDVEQSRLLKTPWETRMGFTGISVRPRATTFEMEISCKEPFDSVAIFYSGSQPDILNSRAACVLDGIVSTALNDTCSAIKLKIRSDSDTDIHGICLLRGKNGIAYNVIGNNGATFGTYNRIANFANDVARLSPSLIIISLGTNEAFGKTSDAEMHTQMTTLIDGLKKSCPNACILLTTPAECQRRTYRGRGRRHRSTAYSVNTNVKRLRNTILEFGRQNHIPTYDFYAVAGGDGSSVRWLRDGKMNKDRIHLLRAGYEMQGNLFTDALENAIFKLSPQ